MRKFFKIHNYSDNMKVRVARFNLKGKADIWWEDVKNIQEEDLTWSEFEELFQKKYPLERYFNNKAK